MKNAQQGFAPLVLIIIIVVILAVGGYFALKSRIVVAPTQSPSTSVSSGETAGWKTYTNTKYGFEFKYPNDWDTSFIEVGKPLNGYRYENPPAGLSFKYNSTLKTWVPADNFTHAEDISSLVFKTTNNGVQWYFTGIADGVGGSFVALIPNIKGDTMITVWIGWSTCPDETQPCPSNSIDPSQIAQQELFEMLSTFKFTNTPRISPVATPNKNCGSFCAPSDCGAGYHWVPNGYSAGDTVKGSCEPN